MIHDLSISNVGPRLGINKASALTDMKQTMYYATIAGFLAHNTEFELVLLALFLVVLQNIAINPSTSVCRSLCFGSSGKNCNVDAQFLRTISHHITSPLQPFRVSYFVGPNSDV